MGIFRDDSSVADKRAAAVERLMTLCPAPLRVIMRGQVEAAMANVSEAELAALMLDVDQVVDLAESGDPAALPRIIDTAKRYGASDSQVAAFRVSVENAGATDDVYQQFGAFLPGR